MANAERTAFPDGLVVPSDPAIPMTPAQLHALFPSDAAMQRFVTTIAHGARQVQSQATHELQSALKGVGENA